MHSQAGCEKLPIETERRGDFLGCQAFGLDTRIDRAAPRSELRIGYYFKIALLIGHVRRSKRI